MSSELAYYDQPALWGNDPLEYQREVQQDIMTLIPEGVTSILDAGCGDGAITNLLGENLHVVGLDFSPAALAHVRREKVLADICRMPLGDESFDLVMANDVLEHLPPDKFDAALAEILRVARRYVVVTVPLLENLAAQTTRCGNCGGLYHINHHYRAFGVADVLRLFGPQAAAKIVLFTGAGSNPEEEARRHLRASLGILSQWELALCPSCGKRGSLRDASPAELEAVARLTDFATENPYGLSIPDRGEVQVLFEKGAAPPGRGSEPAFGLLARVEGEVRKVPAVTVSLEGDLSLEAQGDLGAAERFYVELTGCEALFRLAGPKSPRQNVFTVPAWLDEEALLSLSPPSPETRSKDSLTLACVAALIAERNSLEEKAAALEERARGEGLESAGQQESVRAQLETALEKLSAFKIREAEALSRVVDVSAQLRRAHREIEAGRQRVEKLETSLEDNEQAKTALQQKAEGLARRLTLTAQSAEALSLRVERLLAERKAREGELAGAASRVEGLEGALKAEQARARSLENELLIARLPFYAKVWRGFKARVKALGKGTWVNRREYREALLSQAKPSLSYEAWKAIAQGRRFVMICHDQAIDRRIIQQAQALTSRGYSGIIVALSFDGSDAIDECEGIPVHRIGLDAVVPDCPVYWRYQNRQRWVLWWGRHFRILSAVNWALYKAELKLAYRNSRVHHPLPFDNAFRAAAGMYRAETVVAHDLPALAAARSLAAEWNAALVYDSHELYSEQAAFSTPQKRILDEREKECTPHCDLVLTVSDSLADRIAARNEIARPSVIHNVTRARSNDGPRQRLFHERLGLDETAKIMLFQGGMLRNRNVETLTRGFVQAGVTGLHLVFLGPREARAEQLVRRIAGERFGRSIHFVDAVDQEVLLDYTASADFGVIPYVPCDLNTRFCMPNKLFEYIQGKLPILANDLVEIRRLLSRIGGGGLVADLSGPQSTAAAIRDMMARDLEADREALASVRRTYCWESQQERYLALVEEALAGGSRHAV